MIKAKSFERSAELKNEDFDKELKKFLLGISKLPKDETSNYFSFLTSIKNKKISILNNSKADFILQNYKIIKQHLDEKYLSIYKLFEEELKKKYISLMSKSEYELNISIKYEWSKYIINFDKTLYMSLIFIAISLKKNCFAYSLTDIDIKDEYNNYKNLLKSFGIKKKSDFLSLMLEIQDSLSDDEIYEVDTENYEYTSIEPKKYEHDISIEKLKEISLKAINNSEFMERKRNTSIIQTLKTFYFKNYKHENLINCDCCGESTFLTTNNYPYIEFHHLIPFSTDYGPDHYLNLFGLCPMCHRKMHFINLENKDQLYKDLSKNNNMQRTLHNRIGELIIDEILEPIHLEFLRKENIITTEEFDTYMNIEMIA